MVVYFFDHSGYSTTTIRPEVHPKYIKLHKLHNKAKQFLRKVWAMLLLISLNSAFRTFHFSFPSFNSHCNIFCRSSILTSRRNVSREQGSLNRICMRGSEAQRISLTLRPLFGTRPSAFLPNRNKSPQH